MAESNLTKANGVGTRHTLVSTSPPRIRELQQIIATIDGGVQHRLCEIIELLAPDEFHFVHGRKQVLDILQDSQRSRHRAIAQVMDADRQAGRENGNG